MATFNIVRSCNDHFFIGKELWNVEIGLLSAFLASFSPVDVIKTPQD